MHAAELVRPGRPKRLIEQSRNEIELHCEPRTALKGEIVKEPRRRIELHQHFDIAMDEHVFPRNEDIVEDEDRVVLVEPGRERIVEGRAHRGRLHLVRAAAEEFYPGGVHRRDEHHREVVVGDFRRHVLAEEIVMRQRCRGRHHLGARHMNTGVGLLVDGYKDVLHLIRRFVAVDRRIDDRMVHKTDAFLHPLVPSPRVPRVITPERGIGAECVHQRGFVVWRAAHPTVGHTRPSGNRVALPDEVLSRPGDPEELVGITAGARIRRTGQFIPLRVVVQRII